MILANGEFPCVYTVAGFGGRILISRSTGNNRLDKRCCPIPLKSESSRLISRCSVTSYRVKGGACLDCQFREQCTPSGQDRTISRLFDQNLVEEAKERLSSPLGKQLLQQRKVRAEGVFALAKELHGLRRTRFKGRWKVQIQLWLTAAAINIKRALGKIEENRTPG